MEIFIFRVQLMFMHHHLIAKFVIRRVQHDVNCIDAMVMQVHGSVNKKNELFVVDKTRP
jgi:hypothetical protein